MFTPIREGNRGGRGLFSWEDVRVMSYRDRECYLGSTASLGFLDKGGRWRKKDWWVKKEINLAQDQEEKKKIQNDDLTNIKQALGIIEKPKKKNKLTEREKNELFKKNEKSNDGDSGYSASGLGYLPKESEILEKPEIKQEKNNKEFKKHKTSHHREYKKY